MNALLQQVAERAPAASVSATNRVLESDRFAHTRPFVRLGTWSDAIPVVYPGAGSRLASWMANRRRGASSYASLWDACLAANPDCFRTFQMVRLDRPSFFLPAGDVVFEYAINPSQIPENPPQGVMWRHLEALEMYPQATFYFLQPVFTTHRGIVELYSAGDLREDAAIDRDDAIFAARTYGWLFRSAAFGARCVRDVRSFSEACGDRVRSLWQTYRDYRERANVRKAVSNAVSLDRERAAEFYHRAEELGLTEEARLLKQAVDQIDAVLVQMRIDSLVGDWPPPRQGRRDVDRLVRTARANGTTTSEDALRSSIRREFDMLRRFDPILCFELPDRPGELWFESHWYVGTSGKTYVHF